MKKILVPCDFSEPALQAYDFALNLATQAQAEVVVLKVFDLPVFYDTTFGTSQQYFEPSLLKEMENDAKEIFEKVKARHPRQEQVTFVTVRGAVTFSIHQFAEENKVDVIVMGTRGATGLKEYWIGSNTEKVVRYSKVPVLAIRKSFPLDNIKQIVFPTTLQPDQHDLIARVKELQSFFGAKLHLVLVNTPGNMLRTQDELKMMEEYARLHQLTNYTLNMRNDFSEQDGIINFAHEIKANMIAMGTRGRKGLAHLFMGSVTEDVVNHADYPIWTYRMQK